MQDAAFRAYLLDRGLAAKTVDHRLYALARIERAEATDLDQAFLHDGLAGLLRRYTYSAQDVRDAASNPSGMGIDADKLRSHLAWYKSHLNAYRLWKLGTEPDPIDRPADDPASPAERDLEAGVAEAGQTFALERDLQQALRTNLGQLEPGLKAIDGGSEKRVVSGFVDILAEDRSGVPTIIELKAGIARDAVIAQILGYMTDVAEERACPVRGIIVASDFPPRIERAALAVPNLMLKRYAFRFDFT